MEYDPQDTDVIHLLKKLKDANGSYPPELLALRRQGYLRQVAEVSGAAGLAAGLKNAANAGKAAGASMPPAAGTIVEALLVVALVAEAGAVTYFYRDKLVEYFRSVTNSPKVQEVSSPPVLPSPIAEMDLTTPSPIPTLTVTETLTLTLEVTPSPSPSPELAAQSTADHTGSGSAANAGSGAQTVSTQAPQKGNNGNQYGLTPKPVRTKQPGNNISASQESTNNTKKKP